MTEPEEKYEISEEGEVDRYVRVIFRCRYCNAAHAYPNTSEWVLESELQELFEGPTTLCPGNQEAMLAPHFEPISNGKPVTHAQQFELIEVMLKSEDDE